MKQLLTILLLLLTLPTSSVLAAEKIIIADNGAAGTLIENTLVAVTLAAQDIDYVELNLVMTSDKELIVFNDLTLNRLTDVAKIFPTRNRDDGSYYVIDFTLAEIRQLRLKNVFETDLNALSLPIPTLREELSLIRTLKTQLAREIGISIGIQYPWFFADAGFDISSASLDILLDFGYISSSNKAFIQCFDPEELQRIHDVLMPERQMDLPLIQLIGHNDGAETKRLRNGLLTPYNYDWLYTNSGLKMVSSYAAAIGLPLTNISDENGNLQNVDYINNIHDYGMLVLAYPLNDQPPNRPDFANTFTALIKFYFDKANIDGFFTDSFKQVGIIAERLKIEQEKKAALPPFFSTLELSPASAPTTLQNSPLP